MTNEQKAYIDRVLERLQIRWQAGDYPSQLEFAKSFLTQTLEEVFSCLPQDEFNESTEYFLKLFNQNLSKIK